MKKRTKDVRFWKKATATKYKSRPKTIDGFYFASTKEANRYQELKLLQLHGAIQDLRLQVAYKIEINGRLVCKYVADFVYSEEGNEIVEDVKGFKTQVYNLKKKLMKACHGIEIRET